MPKEIVVFGAGGHAKAVIDTVENQGDYRIAGLLDGSKPAGTKVYGYEVLEDEAWLGSDAYQIDGVIAAIGDNWTRGQVVRAIRRRRPDLPFVTALHPSAVISKGARIGAGSVIMAGAVIGSDVTIGEHAVFYAHSCVEHDSSIGSYVSFAPKAAAGGCVSVGDYTAISIGASIIHGITIGEHSVIGAGSTVIRPIGSHAVAYGTPAQTVRERAIGDRYL